MTPKQREQFNKMRATLIMIASDYSTPDQLRKSSERDYGLDYHEALEMSYENIQSDAKRAVKNVRAIANPLMKKPNP